MNKHIPVHFGDRQARSMNSSPLVLFLLVTCLFLFTPLTIQAQSFDYLIKGGHVIDAKNGINGPMDLAVKDGVIMQVARTISERDAEKVIDANGLYVTPGLIDIHGHHFHGVEEGRAYSNSFSALPPDGFTFRAGVTTVVDVGGAGWTNFDLFKRQVIDRSRTRVLAFINIVGDGMSGIAEQNLEDMNVRMTGLTARRHREIVGVKIAHYSGYDWEPYRRTVAAAEFAEIPVMVDFGGAEPALPLEELFFNILRPGDIYTHAYGGGGYRRQAVTDERGNLRPRMLDAQQRGIVFDIGHGGGSFFYDVAVPATRQGLWPDVISTDLHIGSMNGGMKDMLNVISNMMALGMSLEDVISASTWRPARVIQREDLGHLSEGAVADIAIFGMREGEFGFLDSRGNLLTYNRKLETELTMREGRVVYDLNGLAAPVWRQSSE